MTNFTQIQQPSIQEQPTQKSSLFSMLYILGGRKMAERVDVADLFATRLAKRGFAIDWIMLSPTSTDSWRKTIWRNQTAYIVGKSSMMGVAGKAATKIYEFIGDLRALPIALFGNYDVIQVRDEFVAGVVGLIAAKVKRVPFVFWLSYPFPESRLLDAREKRSKHPLFSLLAGHSTSWLLYKLILPNAEHIFVQSEQMKRDIMIHGISAEKMTAVPMGVSNEMLDKYNPDLTIVEGTVVYLGTLVRVRRLETLVLAMAQVIKQIPNACLLFVGDGDVPDDRAFLESEVARLGLKGAVKFTGFLPMQEAWKIVETAAVCISPFYPTPILRSTSPTKIIEYMALGKPVVANDHPEQSQIIAESGAGLCVEWSEQAFANAIIQLLTNPEKAAEMGQRGPEWVKQHRTYDQIADQVYARYQAILLRKLR
jgi:glycosyltransferase involved in cell wall biosynthesis